MLSKQRLIVVVLSTLLLIPALGCGVPRATYPTAQTQVQIDFRYFYNSLSPHGRWIETDRYGPCWRPAGILADWHPYYSHGHWAYTQYGWTWISHDPWGHIVFHYGSWYYARNYGWVWVPGYTWAPAWVTWRYTTTYIGWAPLPPSYSFRASQGRYSDEIDMDDDHYIFVPAHQILHRQLNIVRIDHKRHREITMYAHRATTIDVVNQLVVNHGPAIPAVAPIRRTPIKLEQINVETHRQLRPVKLPRGQHEIQVAEPAVNRREHRRGLEVAEPPVRDIRERQRRNEGALPPVERIERKRQQENRVERSQQRESERLRKEQRREERRSQRRN